jgi:hypothetical protein
MSYFRTLHVCILVGKPERKRSLRRPRHRCEDDFRMDLREIGWFRIGISGKFL